MLDSDKNLSDLIDWEKDLKKVEHKASDNIISTAFPDIKFKIHAHKELTKLMKKYPIRKVFEVCVQFPNNNFSIPKIKAVCNKNVN